MTEVEFVENSDWQAHVLTDASQYESVVGSGGFIFNQNDEGTYSTPVMDINSARSCYENLRNFFNRRE